MGFALTLVYVFFLFLRPQELNPTWAHYQIMDILGGLAVAATLLSLAMGHRPHLSGPEFPLGLAFLLWSAFSVAAAIRWYGGAVMTLYSLSISFFVFLLVILNVTTRRRLGIVVALACACLLVVLAQATRAYYSDAPESPFFLTMEARGGIDALVDSPDASFVPDEESEDGVRSRTMVRRIRGLGFLADPNDLAQAFVSAIPLLFLLWRRRHAVRNACLVLLPVGVLVWGILLTRSRGALIALAVLPVAAAILRLSPRYRRPAMTGATLLAIPAFMALFGYAKADESAYSRLEAWSAGLLMLKSSPIWGVGSGLFTDHHERVAHNSYVQCFAETGLVGYFLWLSLVVVTLQQLSVLAGSAKDADWARWASALRLSMLAFLLAALFLSRTTSPLLFFLASLPAALIGMAEREGERVAFRGRWWLQTPLVEVASIVLVWITVRASH